MSSSHAQQVADTVRAELARRRVTQGQVASLLGISQAAVSRRLVGAVPFTARELQLIGDHLQVHPGVFFGDQVPA